MNKSTKIIVVITSIVLALIIAFSIFFNVTPTGKTVWNNWMHAVQEADDDSNYETRKQVEDTCRAMIASYKSDKLTYEQYKDSDNEEKQSWAEQAKMRGNKTAISYNEYILKNQYIWEDNVPEDIDYQLEIIE